MTSTVISTMKYEKARGKWTLGIIGGGQLAKMLAQSAAQFGCEVVILEKSTDCPAAPLARHIVLGDWNDPKSLLELGEASDVVTLENEFVLAAGLAELEKKNPSLYPGSETMAVVQDKLLQKQALAKAGLPLPKFLPISSTTHIEAAGQDLGWPLVLKKRCNGYDGKGNFTLKSVSQISAAWTFLEGDKNALYVEEFYPFIKELAVIITRGRQGEIAAYPVVETVQENHICRQVTVPANVPADVASQVQKIAIAAVEQFGMVGSMGVELFLKADLSLCINEVAPRVHNSGHYTIEACECSQFENHVRAVLGWPLGSTKLRAKSALMINLLGEGSGSGVPHGLKEALAISGVHAHFYGKARSVKGRKMGHLTVIGDDPAQLLTNAEQAAAHLQFGEKA